MIDFTYTQLFGLCVLLLFLGGSIAVYGIRFLAWTDRRRAKRRLSSVDLPEQRTGHVMVRIVADKTALDRELFRAQARADTIRDRLRPGGHVAPPRRISDPPPEGMEDRVIERLHALGDDLRSADPHPSSSNPTTEENPDGR